MKIIDLLLLLRQQRSENCLTIDGTPTPLPTGSLLNPLPGSCRLNLHKTLCRLNLHKIVYVVFDRFCLGLTGQLE